MSNKEKARELLEKFRAWAESDAVTGRNDFDELSHLIVALFKEIAPLPAIQFVVAQAQDYLPTFEQINPEIRWPREVLAAVGRLEPIDFQNPDYRFFGESRVYDENNTPITGAAPFVDAVTDLRNIPELYRNQQQRSWNAKGALDAGMAFVQVIWARAWTEWARKRPKEVAAFWAGRKYLEEEGRYEAPLKDFVKSYRIYDKSKERKRIWRKACLAAVKDLEALLENSADKS